MGGKAEGGRKVIMEVGRLVFQKLEVEFIGCWPEDDQAREGLVRVAGSLRRGCETIGDVDVVVVVRSVEEEARVSQTLRRLFGDQKNGKPKRSGLVDGVQVDVLVTDPDGVGAAMMHSTGPARLNIEQRGVAKTLGLKLNEKGLWKDGKRRPMFTEEEIYDDLGLAYLTPEERERKVSSW